MTGAPISPETGLYLLLAAPIVWALLALFSRAREQKYDPHAEPYGDQ